VLIAGCGDQPAASDKEAETTVCGGRIVRADKVYPDAPSTVFCKERFPGRWPFTVSFVTVQCLKEKTPIVVIDKVAYPFTGWGEYYLARDHKTWRPLSVADPVIASGGIPFVDVEITARARLNCDR
jgi:hypothetical protein